MTVHTPAMTGMCDMSLLGELFSFQYLFGEEGLILTLLIILCRRLGGVVCVSCATAILFLLVLSSTVTLAGRAGVITFGSDKVVLSAVTLSLGIIMASEGVV